MVRSLLTQTKINLYLALLDNIENLTKDEGKLLHILAVDIRVIEALSRPPKQKFIILPSSGFLDENQK